MTERPNIIDRFWSRVDQTPTCWIWNGARSRGGYGQIRVEGKVVYAHRFSYETFGGPIPDGLSIDHLCRVVACVRPEHLEAVSHRENCLRGISPAAHHAVATHCKNGHPFSGPNLVVDAKATRNCRTCDRAYNLAAYYRRKANAKA